MADKDAGGVYIEVGAEVAKGEPQATIQKFRRAVERASQIKLPVGLEDVRKSALNSAVREARAVAKTLDEIKLPTALATPSKSAMNAARREAQALAKSLTPVEIPATLGEVKRAALNQARRAAQAAAKSLDAIELTVTAQKGKSFDRRVRKMVDDIEDHDAEVPVLPDFDGAWLSARIAAATRPRTVKILPELDKSASAKVVAQLAALGGARAITDRLRGMRDALMDLDRTVPSIAAVSTALTNVSSMALAGTSNLLALGGSLASIAPLALALPGIFAGFGVGIAGTVIGLSDLFEKLDDLGPKFTQLKRDMGDAFSGKAEAAVRNLVDAWLPTLSNRLTEVSSQLGTFFASMSNAAASADNVGHLDSILASVRDSIDIAGEGIAHFTDAMMGLMDVGASYLPALASWFNRVSESFSAWVEDATNSGEIFGWIDTGIQALQDLGSVIWGIGGVFSNLGRAAAEAGGSGLGELAAGLRNVNAALEGPVWQGALTTVFEGAHNAMAALGPGLSNLADAFTSLAPTIAEILVLAGQVGSVALTAISDAFQTPAFQGGLVSFFEGVLAGVVGLLPSIPALASAFGSVASFAGTLASVLGPVLGAAIEALGPVVESLMGALSAVAPVIGGVLVSAIQTVAPYIQQVVEAISQWVQANPGLAAALAGIAGVVGVVVAAVGSFLAALLPVISGVAGLVSALAPAVAAAGGLGAVMSSVGGAIAAAAGPVTLVVAGIGALVASFVHAYATTEQFRTALSGVVQGVIGVVQPIVGMIVPAVQTLAAGFMDLVGKIQSGLIPVWTGLAELFGAMLNRLQPIIDLLVSILGPALSTVAGVISNLMGIVGTFVGGALAALGQAFSILADLINGDFRGAWDGLIQMFSGIGAMLEGVVQGFVQLGVDLIAGLIQGVMSAAQGVIDFFTQWVTSVIEAVKALFGVASPSTIFAEIGRFLIEGLIQGIQTMIAAVTAVFQTIATAIMTVVQTIVTTVVTAWQAVVTGTMTVLQGAVTVVTTIFTAIRTTITTILTAARAVVTSIITGIVSVIGSILTGAISIVSSILNAIRSTFSTVLNAARAIVVSVLSAIRSAFSSGMNAARAVVSSVLNAIRSTFSSVLSAARSIVTSALSAIRSAFTSGMNAARSVVTSVLNAIRSTFSSVLNSARAVVTSAMNGIRSTFTSILSAIKSAVSSGMNAVVQLFRSMGTRALAALRGMISGFTSVGRNIVQGVINGVSGAAGALTSKMRGMAKGALNAAKGALGIKSPSREFMKVGNYSVEGLVNGLSAGEKKTKDTVDKLAKGILTEFEKKAKSSKGIKVNALSDRLVRLRRDASALAKQAKATRKVVDVIGKTKTGKAKTRTRTVETAAAAQAAKRLASVRKQIELTQAAITAARRGDTKGAAQSQAKSFFERYAASTAKTLESMAKQRESLTERIKKANTQLKDAIKVRDDYGASMTSKLEDTFTLTADSSKRSVSSLITGFTSAAKSVSSFTSTLTGLQRKGLSKGLVDQVAQLGVAGGAQLAKNLANASGAEITSLSTAYEKLSKASAKGGKSLAQSMYQNGVDAAKGLVRGLTSHLDKVTKASELMAKKLTATVRRALKIKSPSRVFAEIGRFTGEGLIDGIEEMSRPIGRAASQMVDIPSARSLALPAGAVQGRRVISAPAPVAGSTATMNLTVTPPETADPTIWGERLADTLDFKTLRRMTR